MLLRKENILIVDDEILVLELLFRHLKSWNYHVFKAISVKEAVSILKDTEISLLITDLKMPEVDGYELLKFASEHYPKMPKLVVTGFPSVQDSLATIKEGAADYLTKPFTKEELKTALDNALAKTTDLKLSISLKTNNTGNKYGEMIGNSAKTALIFAEFPIISPYLLPTTLVINTVK